MSKLIDLSPLISEKLAVFPGDTPFTRKSLLQYGEHSAINLSSITTTVHVGAHADAPSHYHPQGAGIHERDLNLYYGQCLVVEVFKGPGERIYPKDISHFEITVGRILFKTNSFTDPYEWHNHFNALSPELIEFLHKKGVKLVGIDTPSIDLAEDSELISHKAVFEHDMAILEGIVLSHVAPGPYRLIALPLKIEQADASPVRAVLVEESSSRYE